MAPGVLDSSRADSAVRILDHGLSVELLALEDDLSYRSPRARGFGPMYKGDRQISAADLLPVRKLSRKDSNDLVLCRLSYFIVLIGDEYERLYDDFIFDVSPLS